MKHIHGLYGALKFAPHCSARRLNFEGSASVPGSAATARALEARFADTTSATMRPYRLFEMFALTLGYVAVNSMLAASYPGTIPVLAASSVAQGACLFAFWALPRHGNLITAIQLACFFGECKCTRGARGRIGMGVCMGGGGGGGHCYQQRHPGGAQLPLTQTSFHACYWIFHTRDH